MNEPIKRKRGRPRKNLLVEVTRPVEAIIPTIKIEQRPLKVHIYPKFKDDDIGGIARVVAGQKRHLPKFGIEIVEDPEEADVIAYHATVPSSYVKRFPRKAFVAICHGMYWDEYEWDNWSIKANAEVVEGIRVSDAVITCSDWVANSIRRHTSRKVDVIPHGVDMDEWSPAEEPLGYILWNKSRPDPVCDPEPFNQLAAKMTDQIFVSTFGTPRDNVKITGQTTFPQAKELICNASVYLCTARETFGIGTLEAMACGIPVGFRYGGQAEFIEHGVDGWLAQPGDIDGLAEGVRWAIANRALAGSAALRKAESFTWMVICEQYARIFRETYQNKTKVAPRTSIIVTNYNLHEYLTDCLYSVQRQTDEDWECIVVDDASTDARGKLIAQAFANEDHRFKIIRNEQNVYLAEARNIGIRAAKGRYILPLDADDLLDSGAVANLAGALDADREIHVAYGNVLFVNEDGKTPTIYGKEFEPGHSSWPFPFVFEQQIQQMNLLPYCSMFRKEAWEQVGGYRRRCRTAEDADLWTRLSSYGFRPKLVTDSDTLIYRNRTGSMSRKQGENDWVRWFSWAKLPSIAPAGACTRVQLPIPSLDPIQVSVIIPVGPGHEKFVLDAVDSVDAQSVRNWECIVINDTGKPFEIELPSWVHLLETEGKTGAAHARNVGIAASRGKLFLPLDADDYLQPDALHYMMEAQKNSRGTAYSDFYQTGYDGKGITIHECDDYDPQLITGRTRLVNSEKREGMMHSVTVLTPKSAWERVGGYDETLTGWEDWDFQIALGNIGVCSERVPLPLFVYRKHTGFRRDKNYETFDESKEGILRKWGDLWEGRKELMACRSCGARARSASLPASQLRQMRPDQDAVLIAYNGDRLGATPYRGQSKTMYWFAKGDTKYVLAQDAGMFLQYPDFVIVQPQEVVSAQPVLVSEGNPNDSD